MAKRYIFDCFDLKIHNTLQLPLEKEILWQNGANVGENKNV
jgi:hypothetical protein